MLGRISHDTVAPLAVRAHTFKAQGCHKPAQFITGELVDHVARHGLHDVGRAEELSAFILPRQPIVFHDQLTFRLGHFEALVVAGQQLRLFFAKPIPEALQIEGIGLRKDAGIVKRMLPRRLNALHLERQPPARTRIVVDKLDVITRSAVARDMLTALAVMGIGYTLVGNGGSDRPFQAVHLGRSHTVELLTTDQPVLGEFQYLVLGDVAEAGVAVEIGLQLWGKQMIEPCRDIVPFVNLSFITPELITLE